MNVKVLQDIFVWANTYTKISRATMHYFLRPVLFFMWQDLDNTFGHGAVGVGSTKLKHVREGTQ